MKYLDCLGNMFYGVHRDFNNLEHLLKKSSNVGFLYGTKPLAEIRSKKIAVLGVGRNSFLLTSILNENGLKVSAYADNDPQLVGKIYKGSEIISPFDIYDSGDYFVIAANDSEKFEAVVDQFTHCGVEDYAFFFHIDTVINFDDETNRRVIMEAMNTLINLELEPVITKNDPMGITLRLLPGLEWWSEAFNWIVRDFGSSKEKKRVLDIGPGFGFVSAIIKALNEDTDIEWLNMAIEDSTEKEAYIAPYAKKYPIVKHFGMIEDPSYTLDQKYDAIIMTEVFEHFASKPDVALRKIAGMLKEGGVIYLTTPNWENPNFYKSWRDIPEFPGDREEFYRKNKSRMVWMDLNLIHTYLYKKDELDELIGECGLDIVSYELNDCNNFNYILRKK